MLAAGDLVGSTYRIVRLIGQGGMGEVYEAVHEPLSRKVAIKKIRGDLASDDLLARFRREAEASAALGHPNIVQVTDFVLDDERSPAMVMELLEGRTLRDLVTGAQKLEPSRAVFIALQLLSGLAAAHAIGIIHRDVKPANVFLQKTLALRDHVKLLDFGVAKLTEVESDATGPVTRRGSVIGTRTYMAPEQALGAHVDARADLYAVGATLYYALSGWRPADPKAPGKRAPLLEVVKGIPASLAAIVDRALADDPADRFPNAIEMAEALADYSMAGSGMKDSLPPSPENRPSTSTTVANRESATLTSGPRTVREDRFAGDVLAIDDPVKRVSEKIQVITKKMARQERPPEMRDPAPDVVEVVVAPVIVAVAPSPALAEPIRRPTLVRPWYLRGQFFFLVLLFVALLVGTLLVTRR